MHKTIKRIFMLLLTVCMLLSVMAPAVLADTTQTASEDSVTTTYDFGYDYFSNAVASNTTNTVTVSANTHNFDANQVTYKAIAEAYSRDTNGMNWRVGEFKRANVNGTNTRFSSTYGMRIHMAPLDATATATNGKSLSRVGTWVSFPIKSPAPGTYSFTIEHGTHATMGMQQVGVYIVSYTGEEEPSMEDIDSVLNGSDVTGVTAAEVGTYSCDSAWLSESRYSMETDALSGKYTFTSGANHILVLKSLSDKETGSDTNIDTNIYISKLVLTDATPRYNFDYLTAVADNGLSAGGSVMYKDGALVSGFISNMDSYYAEQDFQNWNYAGLNMSGNVAFDMGYCMVASSKVNDWVAFYIKAPDAGEYNVLLDYYGTNYGATASEIYIIPVLAVAASGDMNAAIEASLLDAYRICDDVSYHNSSYSSANPSKTGANTLVTDQPVGSWSCDGSSSEYILVFKATAASTTTGRTDYAYMYPRQVTLQAVTDDLPQTFKSVVALPDGVSAPTCQAAITSEVDGHDYLFMFMKGNKLWVYDLDTKELVDTETNAFGTPRAAVVVDGIVWACGASNYLYRYDPTTKVGEQIPMTVSPEGGVTSFNALGITADENGILYFGSYNRGNLFMYDPQSGEFTNLSGWLDITPDDNMDSDIMYAGYGGLVVRDGYIYCGVDGDVNNDKEETHALIKFSIAERKIVDVLDLAECWTAGVYFGFMNEVGDYLLCGSGSMLAKTIAVDISGDQMELVTLDGDMDVGFSGFVSGELNGKHYCLGNTKHDQGMFEIDPETMYVTELDKSIFPADATKLACWGDSVVTIDDGSELTGESLITYYNDTENQSIDLIFYSPQTNASVTWDNFTGDLTAGNDLQALTISPDGRKIYLGAYGIHYMSEYDVYGGGVTQSIATYDHQIDKLLWHSGYVYAANYQSCTITQINPRTGETRSLFAIKNTAFNQYRMHALAAGDGKVFGGTTPASNRWGGVLVWYDFEKDLTYVAAGPNPEDVFYCDTSDNIGSNEWYSAVDNQPADFYIDDSVMNPPNAAEEYADIEVNGTLVQRFNGVIENQCINSMVYKDGYIYGSTTIYSGSGTNPLDPPESVNISNACLFVYDVAAMKVIATYDLCDAIQGLKTPVLFVESIQEDPLVDGKFWGVISNTLFSYTFDHATNTFHVTEELSFGKSSYNHGGDNLCGREIVFDGNYMYVSFGDAGVYMINRDNLRDRIRLCADVPKHMVLAADGNLYYTDGSVDLKMIEISSYAQPIVANDFQSILSDLPAEVTAENLYDVNRISKVFEMLSDEATAAMDPTLLTAAEEQAAAIFQAQLDAGIPSTLSPSDATQIRALCYAYEKLSGRIQALVNINALLYAVQTLDINTGCLALHSVIPNLDPTTEYNFDLDYYKTATGNEVSGTSLNFNTTPSPTDEISGAYDAKRSYWKLGDQYQALLTNENTRFDGNRGLRIYMTYTTGDATNPRRVGSWVSFPLAAPADGEYALVLNHGTHGLQGMQKVGVYMISYTGDTAPDVQSCLDDGSAAYVGDYSCDNASTGEGGPIDSLLGNTYTFSSDEKYILVLKALEDTNDTDLKDGEKVTDTYIYINQLKLVESVVSDGDGNKYGTVSAAIDAIAATGGTVTLSDSTSDDTVLVPAGVTLDLNGNTLTVNGFSTVLGGKIQDTSDGAGLIACANTNGSFGFDNGSYLPMYDSTAKGYRLYTYTAKKTVQGSISAAKFWFNIDFNKLRAYELLGDNLTLSGSLSWTGINAGSTDTLIFDDQFIKAMAKAEIDNPTGDYALYLNVKGISALKAGDTLTAAFIAEANGVEIAFDIDYTVGSNTSTGFDEFPAGDAV